MNVILAAYNEYLNRYSKLMSYCQVKFNVRFVAPDKCILPAQNGYLKWLAEHGLRAIAKRQTGICDQKGT